jgi:hypothetical protein
MLKKMAADLPASRVERLLAIFGAKTWSDLKTSDIAAVKRAIGAAS